VRRRADFGVGAVAELQGTDNVTEASAWTPDDTVAGPNDPLGEVPGAPPIAPGGAFEFDITAKKGQKLSFATMFVPSNDISFAPGMGGISLADIDGTTSVTSDITLWDAGTEPNEDGVVRQLRPTDQVGDGYDYPDPGDAIEVSITKL